MPSARPPRSPKSPAPELAWEDVQLFLAIAEQGSLTAAARTLRTTQPTVSRRLAELEQRLGHALFERQLAGVVPTVAGERLLEPARKMAEWAAEVARAAAQGASNAPAGRVRITAAPGVAFDFVAPFAAQLRTTHPLLSLEVRASTSQLDLARGEADLALRVRAPASRELALLATLPVRAAVVVAKSYAAQLPSKPRLEQLDWISWAPPFEDVPPSPQLAAAIAGFQPVFTSDDFLVQWRACEAGVGAMVMGWVPHRFALPTALVPLPLELGPQGHSALHLVAARSALPIPRVRLVAELLAAEFAQLGATLHSP